MTWLKSKLHGKISIKHGFPFRSEHFCDTGHHVLLTPGNFFEGGGFKYQVGKEKFYDAEFPPEYLHRKDDLVVAMTEQSPGLLGSMARVPVDAKFLHNQRIGLVTALSSEVNLNYVYYLFKNLYVREQVQNSATGSKVKHTSPERLCDIEVLLPSPCEQEKIAAVLSALDAKIDLNNRINAELEALAKTLYDYWFVQFDFPGDNGQPYKTSGGQMVWNESLKRTIPAGWGVAELGAIEPNIITGKTPSRTRPEYFGGPVPFITIGDIRGGMHIATTEQSLSQEGAETQQTKFLFPGAICVTCIATHGLVGLVTEKSQSNQQINAVQCSQLELKNFLYFGLKNYFTFARAKTGNTFSNMSKSDFSSILFVTPAHQLLREFDALTKPMIEKIRVASVENQHLTQLRDWLLPMLMNGQVTVGDAP